VFFSRQSWAAPLTNLLRAKQCHRHVPLLLASEESWEETSVGSAVMYLMLGSPLRSRVGACASGLLAVRGSNLRSLRLECSTETPSIPLALRRKDKTTPPPPPIELRQPPSTKSSHSHLSFAVGFRF